MIATHLEQAAQQGWDDIAAGRAILVSGDAPTLSGPYVLQADAATVVERLDGAGAPKDAPVVVVGADADALAVAKALYAAGRPLVFQLARPASIAARPSWPSAAACSATWSASPPRRTCAACGSYMCRPR